MDEYSDVGDADYNDPGADAVDYMNAASDDDDDGDVAEEVDAQRHRSRSERDEEDGECEWGERADDPAHALSGLGRGLFDRGRDVGYLRDLGAVGSQPVDGYRTDLGGDVDSRTETFVALKLEVQSWRWAGVPFYLRTGKRLPRKLSEIVVQFRASPFSIFTP